MADKVLLVCTDNTECVTAFNHAYDVKDGFCLVDVTPYKGIRSNVDAIADAAQICTLPQFRPASSADVQRWRDHQKKTVSTE